MEGLLTPTYFWKGQAEFLTITKKDSQDQRNGDCPSKAPWLPKLVRQAQGLKITKLELVALSASNPTRKRARTAGGIPGRVVYTTARQRLSAAVMTAERLEPAQVCSMQAAMLERKVLHSQRQASSVCCTAAEVNGRNTCTIISWFTEGQFNKIKTSQAG